MTFKWFNIEGLFIFIKIDWSHCSFVHFDFIIQDFLAALFLWDWNQILSEANDNLESD